MEKHTGVQKMIQKRLWKEKEFRLEDGILYLKDIGLFKSVEMELRFEDILGERRIEREPNYLLFGGAALIIWLSMVNLIGYQAGTVDSVLSVVLGMLMGFGMVYIVYKDGQAILYLDTLGSEPIGFFRDELYQRGVDDFLEELFVQRKLFLIEKYWDCVDGYEQRNQNLDWLKNRNIVNLEEFKYLKEEKPRGEEAEILPIGFHKDFYQRKCS